MYFPILEVVVFHVEALKYLRSSADVVHCDLTIFPLTYAAISRFVFISSFLFIVARLSGKKKTTEDLKYQLNDDFHTIFLRADLDVKVRTDSTIAWGLAVILAASRNYEQGWPGKVGK